MENKLIPDAKQETLQNILTEEEVQKLTGLTKPQLADCRNRKQLPFLKISSTCRLYREADLVEWLKTLRTVLNQGSLSHVGSHSQA